MHIITLSRKKHSNHMTVTIELEDMDKADVIRREFQKMLKRDRHLLEQEISYNLVIINRRC